MKKVCLVIIFNHRFDKNIDKLKKIYEGRFSHIFFLIPFYNGKEKNIVPVYECSFRFSGYIAQAYPWIKGEYEHYLFLADDMILHPDINENNYKEWFAINANEAYITWTKPIGHMQGWGFGRKHMDPLMVLERYAGPNWKEEIMLDSKAFEIASVKGYSQKDFEISLKMIWNNRNQIRKYPRIVILFFKILLLGRQKCPYPVWGGYSDICIIPGDRMEDVAHMMGVFAGMNLFVEMAIPTAMMLNCDIIKGEKDNKRKSKLLWGTDARDSMQLEHHGDFNQLMKSWDDSWLYLHPIKLSGWRVTDNEG